MKSVIANCVVGWNILAAGLGHFIGVFFGTLFAVGVWAFKKGFEDGEEHVRDSHEYLKFKAIAAKNKKEKANNDKTKRDRD